MITKYRDGSTEIFWGFRWTLGERPVVMFHNPKIRTNVIYTLEELVTTLGRSDEENSFVPVSRKVMQSALDAMDNQLNAAA